MMWEADKLIFRGVSSYVRAYRGSELVWELPEDETAFCITALENTDIAFEMVGEFTNSNIINKNFQIKINRGEWQQWDGSTVSLAAGQKMYIYSSDSYQLSQTDEIYRRITSTGNINVSGLAGSLLNYSTTLPSYSFACLFRDCTTLINSNDLILNWTTATERCYSAMFWGCSNMVTAPALPATTLATYCYNGMFYNCAIRTAPELPATVLATACYNRLFGHCTSLERAPELPATTLAQSCYNRIFNECTSLTTAPSLPATALKSGCYSSMFQDCTSLTTAPELPATTLISSCYHYMFAGCTSLERAPELPAATLVSNCYNHMFDGCSNLNYIKVMCTRNPSTSYTNSWVNGVSETGTYVKNKNASYTTRGIHSIPSGWTIETA